MLIPFALFAELGAEDLAGQAWECRQGSGSLAEARQGQQRCPAWPVRPSNWGVHRGSAVHVPKGIPILRSLQFVLHMYLFKCLRTLTKDFLQDTAVLCKMCHASSSTRGLEKAPFNGSASTVHWWFYALHYERDVCTTRKHVTAKEWKFWQPPFAADICKLKITFKFKL